MTTETAYTRTIRDLSKSAERLRAEIAADPMMAAMFEAMRLTDDEQKALDAAQQAVTDAEVTVDAAGFALHRARRGMAPTYDQKQPFSFFQKSSEHHKAAAQAAAPGLAIDLEEARTRLQSAIRRRNDLARTIERTRMQRRQAVKLKLAPKREPVESRNREWQAAR